MSDTKSDSDESVVFVAETHFVQLHQIPNPTPVNIVHETQTALNRRTILQEQTDWTITTIPDSEGKYFTYIYTSYQEIKHTKSINFKEKQSCMQKTSHMSEKNVPYAMYVCACGVQPH